MTNYIDRLTAWSSSTANFYLEKADLLTHVLFIERHSPVSSSGPVKVNWYGGKKPEGPRVEIPGRDASSVRSSGFLTVRLRRRSITIAA